MNFLKILALITTVALAQDATEQQPGAVAHAFLEYGQDEAEKICDDFFAWKYPRYRRRRNWR